MTRAEGVWLWLSMTQGVSPRMARQLVEFFGSPEELWEAEEQELIDAAGQKIASALTASRDGQRINAHVRECAAQGVVIITPASTEYPKALYDLFDPPCALYCRGDIGLLKTDCLTMVGTRTHTRYGKSVTEMLARELAGAGLTIVSSLGEGLDTIAHSAALAAQGKTIAVLAGGVDVPATAMNAQLQETIAQKGLLISEYAPGTHGSKATYAARNRILAAISAGVLIAEAGEKSGTLLTVSMAMDMGREVFVVPGNIDSPASFATNRLLRTSAEIVLSSRDVLDRLGYEAKETAKAVPVQPMDDDQRIIVEALENEELSFDELTQKTGFSAAVLNSLLTRMKLKGIIEQSAGRVYSLKR